MGRKEKNDKKRKPRWWQNNSPAAEPYRRKTVPEKNFLKRKMYSQLMSVAFLAASLAFNGAEAQVSEKKPPF